MDGIVLADQLVILVYLHAVNTGIEMIEMIITL